MAVYLFANIEVKASEFARFIEVMGDVAASVTAAGWKLTGAFIQRTGQLNTVIDVWELEDFNHMNTGMAAVAQHPEFARISATLSEVVVRESLTFADKLTYPAAKG